MSNDNWSSNIGSDIKYIVGSDEVGSGACAGILVVCAVKAHRLWNLNGLNDSKKLSEKKRLELEQKLYQEFHIGRIKYSLLEISPSKVDEMGLGVALKFAHQCVVNNLEGPNTTAIVDGKLKIEAKYPIQNMIKADSTVPTVMAASILAKTHRDKVMRKMHEKYPMYGWDKNVGYVVAQHKEAIKQHGLSPLHRKSYKLKDI